jgi:hypothetical protein
MIVGKRDRFAIEAEPEQIEDGWILGHFRFWLCGNAVGDWNESADLLGCLRWLRDFAENVRERQEPSVIDLAPEAVFERLYDPVMTSESRHNVSTVADSFSRFHISHLGMSSFDKWDILLLKDSHGAERCLSRKAGEKKIVDCRLWRNEMEAIALEFCVEFR